MITAISCSMFESPSTSDYDEMNKGVSKSTYLEPTIKNINEVNKTFPLGGTQFCKERTQYKSKYIHNE